MLAHLALLQYLAFHMQESNIHKYRTDRNNLEFRELVVRNCSYHSTEHK